MLLTARRTWKPGPCACGRSTEQNVSSSAQRLHDKRQTSMHSKTGVLFVCLGNICRSPTAEAVFTSIVEKAGLSHAFDIDSCGTGGGNPEWYKDGGWSYHEGENADARMTAAAIRRQVHLTSKSRPLQPGDLNRFDYIIGMDSNNIDAMTSAAEYWRARRSDVPDNYGDKFCSMATFCTLHQVETVPDPYYGGPHGFDKVLDLLDDACEGLLQHILNNSTAHGDVEHGPGH